MVMDVIELTKQMIGIRSVTGSEHDIAEFIASRLQCVDVEMQEVRGFGPNVLATSITDPERPAILLNCHMDTVGVMQGWDSDPFVPKIDGNRLYGLGACDMKAGCAIAMNVFEKGVAEGKNIIFCAVSDEEGNSKGSHEIIKKLQEEQNVSLFENGLCIITEDTEEMVKLGARGRYVVEIEISGCSAHGATPECGVNAISEAARIIEVIDELPLRSHPLLGSGSMCILKITGGGDSLSVPDSCTVRVDRHTVIGETQERILKDFDGLLEKIDLNCSYSLSWMERETPFLKPYLLDPEHPWAKRFLSAYTGFYKNEPKVAYGKSVGDFNAFGQIMPTIVYGPAGENVHGPNECVFMDSIKRCRDFLVGFVSQSI
jgi:acetylornithine deacetylase/succinyl-diaminopimelate desuccinylase-like protein